MTNIETKIERQILSKVAFMYDSKIDDMKRLGRGYQNWIYEFEVNGVSFIMRVTKPNTRTYTQVESEINFIVHLDKFDVNVSLPVKSINGNYIEGVEYKDNMYYIVVFGKATGKHISYSDYLDNDDLFYELGKVTGRLHKASSEFSKEENKRVNFKGNYYLNNFKEYIRDTDKMNSFEEHMTIMNTIKINSKEYGLIHGDINVGNFFVNGSVITLFDFDECQNSWFVEDIAIQLFYTVYVFNDDSAIERNNKALQFMKHFLKGYKKEFDISEDMLKLIPVFLILREMIVHVGIYMKWDLNNLEGWSKDYFRDSSKRIINRIPIVKYDSRWGQ